MPAGIIQRLPRNKFYDLAEGPKAGLFTGYRHK
jgi:hypothetical protein